MDASALIPGARGLMRYLAEPAQLPPMPTIWAESPRGAPAGAGREGLCCQRPCPSSSSSRCLCPAWRTEVEEIDVTGSLSRRGDFPITEGLQQGDSVHVWSNSRSRWIEDGTVKEIAAADLLVGGLQVPAGSVLVVFAGGVGSKWVPPGQRCNFLRKVLQLPGAAAKAPPAAVPAAASAPAVLARGIDDTLAHLRSVEVCCKQDGEYFSDPDFATFTNSRVTAWCRPQELGRHDGETLRPAGGWHLFGGMASPRHASWQLFRGTPRADDVLQGELGDCWFLSSLAALAEFQGGRFVRALFPGQDRVNAFGVYLVRLCLGGCWRDVLVDDRLPCIGGGRYYTQLAFCVTRRLQLWASLIEKAFAKVCGSYEAIIGGEASEALSVLTGWPCTLIRFDREDFEPDVLWATLCSSRDAAFLMTCSTGEDIGAREKPSLVPNHVYSLIDVYEVDVDQRHERLVKIRNPHEKTKWQGAWSDASPLWTPELRRRLDCPEGGSPGVFFMALGDFVRWFAHCTICRIRSHEWHEARRLLQIPRGDVPCTALALEVSETTEFSVSLVQPEERVRQGPLYTDILEPLACLGSVLLCLDVERGGLAPAATAQLRCRTATSADCWLHPGKAYLFVPLSLHAGAPLRAVCACVSSKAVTIGERPLEKRAVRAAWAAYARSNDPKGGEVFHGAVLHMGKADGGSIVALAENRGSGFFNVELTLTCDNMRFSRGRPVVSDWLLPGYAQVVQVAIPDVGSGGAVSWRSQHKFHMQGRCPSKPWHSPPLGPEDDDLHAPFLLPG